MHHEINRSSGMKTLRNKQGHMIVLIMFGRRKEIRSILVAFLAQRVGEGRGVELGEDQLAERRIFFRQILGGKTGATHQQQKQSTLHNQPKHGPCRDLWEEF